MAEINYINTIAQLEVRIAELGDAASAEAYALYAEIIRCYVEIAEENQTCEWRVAAYARKCIAYGRKLVDADCSLDVVGEVMERMLDLVTDYRPRLKSTLCEVLIEVLNKLGGEQYGEVLQDVGEELSRLRGNIEAAERGDYGSIKQSGFLQHDPVEWSARWEEVIDEAQREVDERLADEPRGMGFCFSYWPALRSALQRRGVKWRTPQQMNPCVMFD